MTRKALNAINGVTLHDLGSRHSAIISFTLENMEASSVMKKLHERGINVSVSNPCSTPMDADERRLPPIVRVSPHYYNSEDEIGMFASAVGDIALS